MSVTCKIEETYRIDNALGLHARAAAQFASLASKFKSEIFVEKDGIQVNGKSIMGIMALAAPQGSMLTIKAAGEDAGEAAQKLGELIMDKFGED